MENDKIQALRNWMVKQGCLIHQNLNIPSNINGVQGISTNAPIPQKTLIIAVPSKLILTVTKCYNDPKLKKLFLANDDLFDYEASQDAEFNVLCVFMMYHKINIDQSEWREYLQTIAEPQTAVDWANEELKGLNKSMIEEILHVRRQCQKLEKDVVEYLGSRKQFKGISEQILHQTFHYCYRSVMTRCFGYYFNEACLIPIADLINHGCEAIDHQLLHLNFQKQKQFHQSYVPRKNKIDCSLLGLSKPQNLTLPFRERFLVQKKIIENTPDILSNLTRPIINEYLNAWNAKEILDKKETIQIQNLEFCSQNEDEDNDTDEQFEVEKARQLENCQTIEQNQMDEFMKSHVIVEKYSQIEKRLKGINQSSQQTDDQMHINQAQQITTDNQKVNDKNEPAQETSQINQQKDIQAKVQNTIGQKPEIQKKKTDPIQRKQQNNAPVKLIPDSQSEEEDSEDEWGLTETAYFTMSTSSCVAAKKQIYNSYGSRTNKFLLIWYGFAYEDNLYDSVSFRLQVQFERLRPASEIVLDSYIGGQGLSFRKNDKEIVKDTEVSRQFRLKRSNICNNLLIFLRLYLMNYYEGKDLYKLFVTFPASLQFEQFVFHYYKDIVVSLYDRYPIQVINSLQAELESTPKDKSYKIKYKLIYLREQRKLIDLNLKAVLTILEVLQKCQQNGNKLSKQYWQNIPIQILRVIRKYLYQIQKYEYYINYDQESPKVQKISQKPYLQTKQECQEDWEDQNDENDEKLVSSSLH